MALKREIGSNDTKVRAQMREEKEIFNEYYQALYVSIFLHSVQEIEIKDLD